MWGDSFALVSDEPVCSEFDDKQGCESVYDCKWIKAEGDNADDACMVRADSCFSVNKRFFAEDEDENEILKMEHCELVGCWWDDDSTRCRPERGMCAGRTQLGCWLDSDCRWRNGACMFRAEKSSEQAYAEVEGICLCENGAGNKVPVWTTGEDACDSARNKFWQEEIPSTCVQPLDNEAIAVFCENNASLLTPYGKRQCNNALKYVIKTEEQSCLDESEKRYQNSLKDAEARSQRRADDERCRAGSEELYSGAVFSGSGLKGGAIEAHKKLTKSISHETDLKALILGWTKFALELTAVIAVVALVYAGILYVTDLGDGGNKDKAKSIIMWVVIGILVILGSYAIVNTLMKADLGDEGRAEISTTFHS